MPSHEPVDRMDAPVPRVTLAADGVFVTWARPERYQDPAAQARLRRWLDAGECARADRFRFERDRITFVVAHALVRHTLSRIEPLEPAAWRFSPTAAGRPEVASPVSALRFNLSHTEGLVACAVTRTADVGVDVEYRPRRVEISRVAPGVLTAGECADLDARSPEDRRRRFFEYWTLKEAYLKAVGLGFGLSPRKLHFRPDAPRGPEVRFDGVDDRPGAWFFCLSDPTEHHQMALAVRCTLSGPPIVEESAL